MKYKSAMTTQASGSVDGMTASHNRFGRYMRARTIPVNPQSTQQVAVRGLFTMYSQMWANLLTQAQRDSWNLYAANVSVIDKLGDTVFLTGFNWYLASNIPRAQADGTQLPSVASGPATFNRGTFTPPTVASVTASTDLLSLNFTAADAWVDEDDAAMLVFLSRPQQDTIDFFKGPYRYAGGIFGDNSSAPTSPASIALPFNIEVGQVLHGRAYVTRADGRLGVPVTFRGTAV